VVQSLDRAKLQQLHKQEANIELEFLGQKTVKKEDLMPSVKNLAALASLHHSVVCLLRKLPECETHISLVMVRLRAGRAEGQTSCPHIVAHRT